MIPIKKTSGLFIPYDYPDINAIQIDLDRMVWKYNGETTRMVFYEDLSNGILIPRNYPLSTYNSNFSIKDFTNEGEDINIRSSVIPRSDRQKEAVNFFMNNNTGVLKLEPGSGKTVLSIDAISKIGKKAIVLVHKKSLRDQWIQEISTHTNLMPEDVGSLSRKNYVEELKKPIIVTTVQGICSFLKNIPEFKKELDNANIGIAIFDEAHTTVGPEKFSMCSLALNCKRVYGLSATPHRNDGNDDIIKYHLGETSYFQPSEDELLKPIVFMIYFPFGVYSQHEKYLTWGGGFSTSRYYQQLHKSKPYIQKVCKMINRLYIKDRTVLALGVRINCLLTIAEQCEVCKSDTGIFIPTAFGNKKYKKTLEKLTDTSDLTIAFNEKKVVFSTYTAARDGNNRKSLDTLIMTVPTGNVDQAAGRVLRVLEGKKQPYVIDLIDTEGPLVTHRPTGQRVHWFEKSALYRKELYMQKGWEIKEYEYEV